MISTHRHCEKANQIYTEPPSHLKQNDYDKNENKENNEEMLGHTQGGKDPSTVLVRIYIYAIALEISIYVTIKN